MSGLLTRGLGFGGPLVTRGLAHVSTVSTPTSFDACEAVCETLLADSSLNTTFGRAGWLWIDEAPPEEPIPVAVMTRIHYGNEAQTLGTSSSFAVNDDSFQINVFASSRSSAKSLSKSIAEAIEAGTYTCQEGTIIDVQRAWSGDTMLDPDLGVDGRPVWGCVTDYLAMVAQS